LKKVYDVEIEQSFTRTKQLRIIANNQEDLETKVEESTQGDARRLKCGTGWNCYIVAIHGEITLPDAVK
jgi:hypothetical protein|tara:strand:+ start:58 stop:264 length:207 start_codon:yes stop_codon:yes gene_type:complete